MRLVMEIRTFEQGTSPKKVSWAKLTGVDQKGRHARAVAFEGLANKMAAEINRMLLPGESIGSRGFMIDLTGEWRARDYVDTQGVPRKSRSFSIASYDILMGPVLELAKLRKAASSVIATSEAARADGRLEEAYRTVAQFAAELGGISLDIEFEEAAQADDEAEFGIVAGEDDPEASAAARYASIDGTAEKMEIDTSSTAVTSVTEDDDDVIEMASDSDNPDEEPDVLDDDVAEEEEQAKPAEPRDDASEMSQAPVQTVAERPKTAAPAVRPPAVRRPILPPRPRSPGM